MTRAALWLSQQSAYAPDAFLREPERDHPLFLSPSDINTLDANKQPAWCHSTLRNRCSIQLRITQTPAEDAAR